MDFLDPKKKRANITRLYIGYALMALGIGIGTLVILYSSFGYGLDSRTGNVIQNGLLFISSQPGDANINLRNKATQRLTTATTNTKLTIPEGNYQLRLNKQGYREWVRDFVLEGASVERLVYPLLIPQDITSTPVKTYSEQPKIMTNSPDRKWLVVLRPGSLTDFDVFDAGVKEPQATLRALPAGLLTQADGTLELVEWSTNNKHMLLKHMYGDKSEYILFNHEAPEESLNVNKRINLPLTEVTLFDKQPDQVYGLLSDGHLERFSLKENSGTIILPRDVIAFKAHGNDMIAYVSKQPPTAGSDKVTLHLWTGNQDYVIRELPANTTYLLDLARYDSRWYVVAGAKSENKVYAYEDPLAVLSQLTNRPLIPARTLRADNPVKASFSANARFIAVQGGQDFSVYDIETGRMYRHKIDAPLDPAFPATWMDGHRMTAVSDQQIVTFDFDGSNFQSLTAATHGTLAQFDRDYTAYYSLNKNTENNSVILSRSSLVVN